MKNQTPPNNDDAEQMLIATLITDPECIEKIHNFLAPKDFFNGRYKAVYKGMLELWGETSKIDLILLKDKLESMGILESEVGGMANLAGCASTPIPPSPAHIVKYSKAIKEDSIRRELIYVTDAATQMCFSDKKEVKDILSFIEKGTMDAGQEYTKCFETEGVQLDEAIEMVADRRDEAYKGFKTHIPVLDEYTLGLKEGHLWMMYAKSAAGKTTVAIQMCKSALQQGANVRFISMEMDAKEIWNKFIQVEENPEDGNSAFGPAFDRMKAFPGKLVVEDTIYELGELRRYVKQHAKVTNIFVIDFLSLIDTQKVVGKHLDEISNIIYCAREVQRIAHMNKAMIICLAQANTENPNMAANSWSETVKGGNSVKQVADVMVKLTRNVAEKGTNFETQKLVLTIQKNKHGRSFEEGTYPINAHHGGILIQSNSEEPYA